MVTEDRRETGAGGRMASPGFCCVSAWLDVQAETPDLSLVTLPSPAPTASSLLCNLCSGTCCSRHAPYPHHFPECPSGRAPLSCQSRKQKLQNPTFCCPRSRTLPVNTSSQLQFLPNKPRPPPWGLDIRPSLAPLLTLLWSRVQPLFVQQGL